jgi:Tfp pilus assembly protein PilF
VLLASRIRPARRDRRFGGDSARQRSPIAVMMFGFICCAIVTGCASFGRSWRAEERTAACRDLTRQGISATESGQWQQAESLLREALEKSPDDAEAERQLAEVLWQRGANAEAAGRMAAALQNRPTDPTLAVRAGEMALGIGNPETALSHAELAIRLDPQLGPAWALRGRVFWQLQQPDRAMADLQRALEFVPNNPEILLDIAVIYRQRRQAARCLTTLHHLHDSYSLGEEPQSALVLEGLTLMDLNRPHQAADAFLAASRREPANAQVFYYLAQAHSAAGHYAEASAAANQALAIDTSHQPSRQLLAQLAAQAMPADPQRR